MVAQRLFVFSGQMFSGKDFVAEKAGLSVLGFADPMYQLCEYIHGTCDKAVPGIRKCLQQLGQWGWGCVSDSYPMTSERAIITRDIRVNGSLMTRDYGWVKWGEFGKRNDFWVNILLCKLGLTKLQRKSEVHDIAITNARFKHELKPCTQAGFSHFHVRCSEDTRLERMERKGYKPNNSEVFDVSEGLAQQLDELMPDDFVVWNDFRAMPEGKQYLEVEDFLNVVDRGGVATLNGISVRKNSNPVFVE